LVMRGLPLQDRAVLITVLVPRRIGSWNRLARGLEVAEVASPWLTKSFPTGLTYHKEWKHTRRLPLSYRSAIVLVPYLGVESVH
jgi:hypothetical protein